MGVSIESFATLGIAVFTICTSYHSALHLAIIHNHQDVVLQLLDVLPQLPPSETPVVDCLNNFKQVRPYELNYWLLIQKMKTKVGTRFFLLLFCDKNFITNTKQCMGHGVQLPAITETAPLTSPPTCKINRYIYQTSTHHQQPLTDDVPTLPKSRKPWRLLSSFNESLHLQFTSI